MLRTVRRKIALGRVDLLWNHTAHGLRNAGSALLATRVTRSDFGGRTARSANFGAMPSWRGLFCAANVTVVLRSHDVPRQHPPLPAAVRRSVRRSLAVLVTIVVGSILAGLPLGAAAGDSVLFGAYAQPRNGESLQAAVESLEADLGTTLPIVRSFGRFDTALDNPFNRWAAGGGRTVLASITTDRRSGERLQWRAIADATPGSAIHDEMVALAKSATRVDGDLWVIFSHEPEASFNQGLGSSADFVDAWRALHSVFRSEGATDVRWVWTMTSWSYEVATIDPEDRRRAELWYPGDAYVDLLGADPYNWNQCRGNTRETWESLEDTIRPFLDWSGRHPGKGLVLPEFGSVEGDPGAKARWLRDAAALMKRPEWSSRFEAIVYFHDDHSDTRAGTQCRWWLDSSEPTLQAAREIAHDPYFTGHASPAGPPPTTSPPPPTTSPPPPSPPPGPVPKAGPPDPVAPPSPLSPAPVPECAGRPATIVGTPGPDVLVGTPGADVIVGLGGRDRIHGGDGADVICGGSGNDLLVGGGGPDRLIGQDGRDVLRGGGQDDVLTGGRQRDRLGGGSGNDRMLGGAGRDVLVGSGGDDVVNGGFGNDVVYGNAGADVVTGGSGVDRCHGGGHDDRIHDSCEVRH